MAENLARIKAVRAGNRAVITKLTKEAEYILQQSEVNTGRLPTIGSLSDEKLAKIKDLDSPFVVFTRRGFVLSVNHRPTSRAF